MTVKRRVVLFFLLALVLILPATAQADTYGSWSSAPGVQAYNPDIAPFNDQQVTEATSFVCAFEDGTTLTPAQRDLMSALVLTAADTYNGQLSFEAADSITRPLKNGGYESGQTGMQQFLQDEQILLQNGAWTPYAERELNKVSGRVQAPDYAAATPGWYISTGEEQSGMSRARQQQLAALVNLDAQHPLELSSELPEACALDPLEPEDPQFADVFSDTGNFFTQIMLYVPAGIADAGHDYLQPYAFKYTFWTPHTERGDLLWTVPQTCSPRGPEGRLFSSSQIRDGCAANQPLGYSEQNTTSAQDRPWFLSAATLVQWLLSGVYMLIFFTAAVLYMFRANRNSATQILRLVPRLLLSVVLVVLAGQLIGLMITISNLAVQFIFDLDQAPTVGAINTYLLQAGPISGGSYVFQQLISLLMGASTVFFYVVFFMTAIIRQILLVALIIFAPVAAMCLVVDRWRDKFNLYVRILAAVVVLPVVLAALLRLGMSINPLLLDPISAYGTLQGLAGLAVMWLTMYLMYRTTKLAANYAVRGSQALNVKNALRQLAEASGASVAARENILEAPAKLVPPDKHIPAATGGGQLVDSSRQLNTAADPQRPPASLPTGSKGVRGLLAAHNPRPQNQKRINSKGAKLYKQGLNEQLQRTQQYLGRELDEQEKAKVVADYEKQAGGRLQQVRGSWYLVGESEQDNEGAQQPENNENAPQQ